MRGTVKEKEFARTTAACYSNAHKTHKLKNTNLLSEPISDITKSNVLILPNASTWSPN